MKQFHHFGSAKNLGVLLAGALVVSALGATTAKATVITETDSLGPLSNTLSHLTTGGPFTFITASPSFTQFNSGLGTLVSATLTWAITGSENGTGNFAGTGIFSYGGSSQTVTFDTISDPGPKSFNFTGTDTLSLAAATGSGSFVPSVFDGTIQQSGFFPWGGTMSASGSITLTLDYNASGGTPGGGTGSVPEPATLVIFGSGLALLGMIRRRNG